MDNTDVIPSGAPLDSARTVSVSETEGRDLTWTQHPTYAAKFRCIGPACEDPCCSDWDIPLDRQTYELYRRFPAAKLGTIVSLFVQPTTPPQPDELYAQIHRMSTGCCPFYDADHLCRVQKEYSADLLSSTCSIYPRALSRVDQVLEGTLSLSCPEAARNILLESDYMHSGGDLFAGGFRTDNSLRLNKDSLSRSSNPHEDFLAIRRLLIGIILDRSRPIWRRLLRIGELCRRLEAVPLGGEQDAYTTVLRAFREPEATSLFDAEIHAMPSNPSLRLELVFGLTDQIVQSGARRRFQDVFWNFVEGIGTATSLPTEEANDDLERFLIAERNYHGPFFDKFPFILENYLVNYMLQNLFPFGRVGSVGMVTKSVFTEYLQMTTQFAWINALLIGVAGLHRTEFDSQHVVQVIQSFSRTVEHSPTLLDSLNEYIKARGLNSLQGMAILLRS